MLHLVRSTPTLAVKQQPMAPPAPMYAAASAQMPIGWGAINPTQNDINGSGNAKVVQINGTASLAVIRH